MKQRKKAGRFTIIEALVVLAIVLILASILIPMFWHLDKGDEMNLRLIGMATCFVAALSLAAWFIQWLFDLTRPVTVLIVVLVGVEIVWLSKIVSLLK
jgi:hypothetical protein